jgi:hypothetical protein
MDDTAYDQMRAAHQANKQDDAKRIDNLKDASRERLLKIIEKKIRTTMIGALAAIEETIGRELWGHGKPDKNCTPEELRWRGIWLEKVRPAILNNGNSQLRAMQAEVVLYDMMWNGYRKIYLIKPGTKEGTEQCQNRS